MMKQIVLITDGCSNVGMSPVAAAAHAASEEITVNVAGVIDGGDIGERGAREIREIARAGQGMSRIVSLTELSRTVQMMTRKTVTRTMHRIVQKELRQILNEDGGETERSRVGHADRAGKVEELPPPKRAEVVRVIDEWSEQSPLRVALLIDTSASMRPKLNAVRETVRDLMLSLQARSGPSEVAVFHFPGTKCDAELDLDWTENLVKTEPLFYKLNMKGTTPTGPAIMKVVQYFMKERGVPEGGFGEESAMYGSRKEGMIGDYFV